MNTPYYSKDGIILYCADSRELLPEFQDQSFDVVLTDPVWPNAVASLAGSDDPAGLFASAAQHFPRLCKRAVVQLGCDSDPRFLLGMPAEMRFFRLCWLGYSMPSYKGRVLYQADAAYAFGEPPRPRPAQHLIPGMNIPNGTAGKRKGHPCARLQSYVEWLVRWFAAGPILDPFAGIGTTLIAAKLAGYPATGIEIDERFCERAARRLDAIPAHLFPEVQPA